MFYITLGSLILTILSFMYFFLQVIKRYIFHEKAIDFKLKMIISSSCIVLFWLLTYSLNAVYERIQNPIVSEGVEEYAGTLGDLVGGTLNPVLGLFGIIVGGLAFYAQYQANKQIQEQFKIQQFETRLFKMLEIYNKNVDNLTFISRKKGNIFKGKMVFPSLISNFNELKKDIKKYIKVKNINLEDILEIHYKENLIKLNKNLNQFILLELSYIIFLYGTGKTGRENIKAIFGECYNRDFLNEILNYLSNRPIEYKPEHNNLVEKWNKIFINFENFPTPNNEKFDKYYNGHQNNLAHYFRHLYMIIRYINEEKNISYIDKWEYSKLLRTQLSNHEQILFFLNSISIVGRDWEFKKTNVNEQLVTKYDLIKNITKSIRDYYKIENFYPNVVYEDIAKNTLLRKDFEKNIYN